ncbi:hypothetical protein FGIG_11368 [Fasciola gigantica]|uniref:Uncharacterized protein n=1 Tax=Fasciola gigantica TaxID=46835 RepID=A0A504Z1F6_FASGI|nr:hypothetical protein FGIG_11368 [Fasciola gigantica]
MAGQLPPPLPGPPFPVPDLVPIKRNLKRHSIANGTEHAAIARQVINSAVIVKPQIPDIFTRTAVAVSSSAPSGSESPSTATIDQLVSPPKAPPTIAESVTGSEFESVYNANWHLEHESLKLRDCIKSDTSGTRHSQESLLSELIKQQSTDSSTQNGPTMVQAEATRDGSECLTEPETSAWPKSMPSKKPALLKSVVIPASLKVEDKPSHISLSIQNGEPSFEEKSRQSRKQRWSVVEQPPKNRVSQVASAWEQYFNPFCRVKRSHSTGTQPNQPKQQRRTSLSQVTRSCGGSQPNSASPVLQRSTIQKIECVNPQTGFKEPTTVQKHRQSCSNITLSDSSLSESMNKCWTNSVAKLSKTSKEKCAKSSVSTSTQLHSTEPISSTFSSISSVDAFVLLPVRDLVEAYVRCNGSAAGKQIDNSQKHGSAHLSDSTVNQAQLVAGSLLSFSDSIAQMSQTSSSTITVSDANIAAQEKMSQQQLTENLSPPPNRRICSPMWLMSRSTMCERDPRSELEKTKLHPRPTFFRSRSVSTPNYPHRPLSVTVTRHQVRVTASSSKSSSTDSARHASPLVLARHTISQPQTKTKLQSQSQPQPTHQPGSVSNGHMASAIGCYDLNTQGEPKKLTSVGALNQSDRGIFGVTLQPHGTVVLNRNESGNHELVGRRRRITVSQFSRWPEPLTSSAQTAVPTIYLGTRLDAAYVISEPTSEVKSSEVCTTTRCIIDQSRIENTRSKSRNTEKRTRSLSATSVPSHSLSSSNSPTGSHPYTFNANAMDLSEQTRSLNEVQPFRGMRSRGIYKRNIGDRLSSDPCRGGVNSRHDPRVHCGVESHKRSIGQRTNEPVTEKTSALSPASQRYEQHIQAQRLNPNEVPSSMETKVTFDPNNPVSLCCAPSADCRNSPRGVLPTPLLSGPPIQETAAQTEMKQTREVTYIAAPSSTAAGLGKQFTLDQALDGSFDSPTPRRALPTIAPLPPLAQTRCSKSNSNPVPLDPVRITSSIVPAKQAPVKQASLAGPHLSFDCKPTGALRPKIVTECLCVNYISVLPSQRTELRDYETLGAFSHNTGSNVPTVRTNNYNPITTATATGNSKATDSNNSHGTASDANDTESAKPRSFSQISFSPSYNDALNLHSTPRTDGWRPNESTSKTKPGLGKFDRFSGKIWFLSR